MFKTRRSYLHSKRQAPKICQQVHIAQKKYFISITESDVNICLAKGWTVIERSSIIWKSDQFDKIKCDFFQAVAASILQYGCTTWMITKHMVKKLYENYMRMVHDLEEILEATTDKTATVQLLNSHLTNHSI